MKTKQVIAVIGASGEMGSVIAKSISNENYRILLQSSNLERLLSLVEEIKSNKPSGDVEIVNHPLDACWEADIIMMACRYSKVNSPVTTEKGKKLLDKYTDKNRYPPLASGSEIKQY